MKAITLIVHKQHGKNERFDIRILPDTTVEDILRSLNLNGYLLLNPDGCVHARSDKPYESVVQEQKIYLCQEDRCCGA